MSSDARGLVGTLTRWTARTAVLLDYDGTLAPIVDDPAAARPLPETGDVLAALGRRIGRVAVVSGRPAAFLAEMLGRPAGVDLFGLYGMEATDPDGSVRTVPEFERWRAPVAQAADLASATAPPSVEVERKGLSVTLHWRADPAARGWVEHFAAAEGEPLGLVGQPGRMSIELRPPVTVDKGTVVTSCAEGFDVVAFFGDDLGDLPAFRALAGLRAVGKTTVAVAVVDDESAPEVAAAADVELRGPAEALEVLRLVAQGSSETTAS